MPVGPFAEAIRWDQTGIVSWVCGHQAPPGSRSPCAPQQETSPVRRVFGGQGPSIMRISGGLGSLEILSNPSPTKLNFVGLGLENIEWVLTDLEATIIVEANVSLRVVVV